MVKITCIETGGAEYPIDVTAGISVMEAAVKNGVPGIDADCGGACACATCHVYVDSEWASRLVEPDEQEIEMLACAVDADARSRLSCQIPVSQALDGLVIHIPDRQR